MTAFFIMFIAMLLSGFAFPVRSMPMLIQWLAALNPVRWYMEALRGLYMKGVGLAVLWQAAVALMLIGVTVLSIASFRFKKSVN